MKIEDILVGSDFSGVGAFEQALKNLKIKHKTVFACDIDNYARKTYEANHKTPNYFPFDVYDRKIPDKSLDIYMTSPPCQAFSLAGKRKGENDKRGVLFYNSYKFISKNKPRFFIFENVKGLLSDDKNKKTSIYGKTFTTWLNYLGGKTVNGNTVLFPHQKALPYHIYFKVLNSKHYGVPQNRERIFIIGIRDDKDNNFSFPKKIFLKTRLKDVLDKNVDKKYFLSDNMLKNLIKYNERQIENGNGFAAKFRDVTKVDVMDTIKVGGKNKDDLINVGYINQNTQASKVISEEGVSFTLSAGTHGYAQGYVETNNKDLQIHIIPEIVSVRKYKVNIKELQKLLIKHKTLSNKKISEKLDQNLTTVEHWFRTDKHFSIPDSKIWFKLKEVLNIKTIKFDKSITEFKIKEGVFEKANRCYDENGIAPTITSASANEKILIAKLSRTDEAKNIRKLNLQKGKDYTPFASKKVDFIESDTINCITTATVKDNLIIQLNKSKESGKQQPFKQNRVYDADGISPVLDTECGRPNYMYNKNKIRRLTPIECFKLQGFTEKFVVNAINNGISETQLYKQAGNSITVQVLEEIIKKLKIKSMSL